MERSQHVLFTFSPTPNTSTSILYSTLLPVTTDLADCLPDTPPIHTLQILTPTPQPHTLCLSKPRSHTPLLPSFLNTGTAPGFHIFVAFPNPGDGDCLTRGGGLGERRPHGGQGGRAVCADPTPCTTLQRAAQSGTSRECCSLAHSIWTHASAPGR